MKWRVVELELTLFKYLESILEKYFNACKRWIKPYFSWIVLERTSECFPMCSVINFFVISVFSVWHMMHFQLICTCINTFPARGSPIRTFIICFHIIFDLVFSSSAKTTVRKWQNRELLSTRKAASILKYPTDQQPFIKKRILLRLTTHFKEFNLRERFAHWLFCSLSYC